MANSEHYDVIIIGAGPAGSATAIYINPERSGLRVLLLEGKKEVGVPLQCGEAMPTYDDLLTVFPKADCRELFDLPDEVQAGAIEGLKFKAPSGRIYTADLKGQMYHRDKLDQHLFKRALACGAEYRLNSRVKKIAKNQVWTSDDTFTADFIVGADGVFSVVSKAFPAFVPNRDICACAFVLASGDFKENVIQLWYESRFTGGYFWLFPKSKASEANIGLGVRGRANVRTLLERELQQLSEQGPFLIKYRGGGAVPLSGLKPKIVSENIALVGDAAGMVFPTNGGGTGLAMMAGKWLGEIIAKRQALIEYEKKVQAILGPVLKKSLRTRRQMDLFRKKPSVFSAVMWLANLKGWRQFIVG
ncbi:MAG: geranylgeranyl reductase family protein [bacterium]